MSPKLDLCHSIQLGSDPGESSGVVQAWNQHGFNESGKMEVDWTAHFVTWETKPREVSSPNSPAPVARLRRKRCAWHGLVVTVRKTRCNTSMSVTRREARVSLCLTDSD